MKFMLLSYASEQGFQAASQDQIATTIAAFAAYTEALKKAGAYVTSHRLQPVANATTVRVADGKTHVLNGPYVETREQLGGYFLIDVPDVDAALSWAARCPGAGIGAMEVRPLFVM